MQERRERLAGRAPVPALERTVVEHAIDPPHLPVEDGVERTAHGQDLLRQAPADKQSACETEWCAARDSHVSGASLWHHTGVLCAGKTRARGVSENQGKGTATWQRHLCGSARGECRAMTYASIMVLGLPWRWGRKILKFHLVAK